MNNNDRMILCGCLLLATLISVFFFVGYLDSNNTEIKINTDMISACSKSEDVVGCLKALQTKNIR